MLQAATAQSVSTSAAAAERYPLGAAGCVVCRSIAFSHEGLLTHLERDHHLIQQRNGESYGEAETRFLNSECGAWARYCYKCREQNRPWVIGVRSRWSGQVIKEHVEEAEHD